MLCSLVLGLRIEALATRLTAGARSFLQDNLIETRWVACSSRFQAELAARPLFGLNMFGGRRLPCSSRRTADRTCLPHESA
jgi:hypothetical protein